MPRFKKSESKDYSGCQRLELAPNPCGNPCGKKCNKRGKCYIFCRHNQICQYSNQQASYKQLGNWSKFFVPLRFLAHILPLSPEAPHGHSRNCVCYAVITEVPPSTGRGFCMSIIGVVTDLEALRFA